MFQCGWGGIEMSVEECAASNYIQMTQVPIYSWDRWVEPSVRGTKYREVVKVLEITKNMCCCWGTEQQQWGWWSPVLQDIKQAWFINCIICVSNHGVLEASAKVEYPLHRSQCQPGTHKNPGAGRWKRKDTETTRALLPCCQCSQYWEVGEAECHSKSCGAATSVQQPAGTILDSPSFRLHDQHCPYRSRRKEKEELSNLEHLYRGCCFATTWEREGTSFYSSRRGTCPYW